MDKIYEKTWGIIEGYNKGIKKWFVVSDGKKMDLCYTNKDFALKKSENFTKSMYKDFIDFQRNNIHFTFKQI